LRVITCVCFLFVDFPLTSIHSNWHLTHEISMKFPSPYSGLQKVKASLHLKMVFEVFHQHVVEFEQNQGDNGSQKQLGNSLGTVLGRCGVELGTLGNRGWEITVFRRILFLVLLGRICLGSLVSLLGTLGRLGRFLGRSCLGSLISLLGRLLGDWVLFFLSGDV